MILDLLENDWRRESTSVCLGGPSLSSRLQPQVAGIASVSGRPVAPVPNHGGTHVWFVYVLIISVIEMPSLSFTLGPPGGRDNVLLVVCFLNLSQCIVAFGTMLMLRAVGFRLARQPK
jgi:hypothetical protein